MNKPVLHLFLFFISVFSSAILNAQVNLLLHIHNQAPQEQKQSLEQSHLQWKGNLEQVDDILVVGLFF